ncbi:MAG TPA: hypothetical protein PL089_15375 [Ignavibacteria bacterium]|nr:hypothetical protein [Ignavibacteria bacterium]
MNKAKIETELMDIEDSVRLIRAELNSTVTPGITFGPMTRSPLHTGVMLANNDGDVIPMPYTGLACLESGGYEMKYAGWGFKLNCFSQSGEPQSWFTSGVTKMTGNGTYTDHLTGGYGAYTSEKFKGNHYHCHHLYPVRSDGKCRTRFYRSPDGKQWTDISDISTEVWAGEDRSFMIHNKGKSDESMYMFIRPYLPNSNDFIRHIDVYQTFDGLQWNFVKRLITASGKADQYYSMSACQVGNLYYGNINHYDELTDRLSIRLFHTTDILDITKFTYVAMYYPVGVEMQFGAVSYDKIRKEVVLLAGEAYRKHNEGPAANKYIKIIKYSSKVTGL